MNRMDHNNINLASNDMSLQQNSFSLNQNQYGGASTANNNNNNANSNLVFNEYGDDHMIGLVLGDLDFLMTQSDYITSSEPQQQQQQQTQQSGGYHIPQQQQQQQQVSYQAQNQMQPPSQQMGGAGYSLSMGKGLRSGGISEVNLLDLHDEQSERIKSEVIGMNILNMMPGESANTAAGFYPSSAGASSGSSQGYLSQMSAGSMEANVSQYSSNANLAEPQAGDSANLTNFDFIFPDKSSKEILECLINDETDMFDSLFAPRIDHVSSSSTVNAANNGQSGAVGAPLRSISSQFNDLFRMNSTGDFIPTSPPLPASSSSSSLMPPAPSKKGKFLKTEPLMQPVRSSARLQSKRIVNCTKSEPMEPSEPVFISASSHNQQSMPSTPMYLQGGAAAPRMPGKLESYNANIPRHPVAPYKRKRSYEDDSDNSNDDSYPQKHHAASREMSHFNSTDESMDPVDAETQFLLDQSSNLLAALQRQSRLTGNSRVSNHAREIEKQLQFLKSASSASSSMASKTVPNFSMESSRRNSVTSADQHNDEEGGPVKKESNKDAAFRYRLKKLSEKDRLFETREILEKENGEVKRRIELAQAEISYLKNLLVQMLLNKGYLDSSRVVS